MKTVNVGICGLGTVGSGTCNVLQRNQREVQASARCDVKIVHVGARRDNAACNLEGIQVSRDIFEVVKNPEVNIVVELIGGTTVAKDLILQAIELGKHVVTANKALIAEHGNEIFAAAEQRNVCVAFEGAVAGGIPIIKVLRESLAANRIQWLAGIINGTGNFILTEMAQKGRAFDEVLAQAQELGYAEADPTFDIEGIDAAHKLGILASIAFGMPLRFDRIYTEGISKIEPQDLAYAKELGYRIKHLGIARRSGDKVEMRVHPTLIPEKRLIAHVDGVMNAIMVMGDAVGSTLYSGPGAGSEPTASAVVADVIDIARELALDCTPSVPHLGFGADYVSPITIQTMDELETSYYLRMSAWDRPGVLSEITQILSKQGISIEALIQKEPAEDQDIVPVILLTNRAVEGKMMQAIQQIEALVSIAGQVVSIRLEHLD
ncbi:MAG: homoserine dehydrogenase [Cellvibrionaceae bacterium]